MTFILQVRKNPENLTQETCPDRGSNPGPLCDRQACYRLLQSGGLLKSPKIKFIFRNEPVHTHIHTHTLKVKVSPLQTMKDEDARVHIFSATALGRGRVVSTTLYRLYPWESPSTHFTGCSVVDQCEHEGVKKNFNLSDNRDRTRTVQPVARRLAA